MINKSKENDRNLKEESNFNKGFSKYLLMSMRIRKSKYKY